MFENNKLKPSDFKCDILRNSQNKNDLHIYLAERFNAVSSNEREVVATYDDSILSNFNNIQYKEDIAYGTIQEADQRIIRHVINCAKNDFQNVVLCTGDTDVLVLLISFLPLIPKIKSCNIICKFGIRDNQIFYNVVLLSKELGDDVTKALPFFHGFTGCDTFSSFYNHSKLLSFDAPFSKSGWLEHIKQYALRSGWLWKKGEKNVTQQDQVLWGWVRRGQRLVNNICKTYTCSSKCRSYNCSKSNMKCLPFCGCKNRFENKSFM